METWEHWPEDKGSYESVETGLPTVKWRGQSVNHLRQAQRNVADSMVALKVVRQAIDASQHQLQGMVSDLLGQSVQLGTMDCPESPTLSCIYEKYDYDNDSCLFCEQPHDRR